ncbi:MAG: SMC-Scp complex subunit ScpB [Candidatus Heimdallarchaeota archaeon]|nr:MAG: SMC-Scp complex subunit ScpB [Candidatus Heimdallarchaeota archaeon]
MDIKALKEKNVIEAALYLYDRPMSFGELAELVQKSEGVVERLIEKIRDEHLDQNTAYSIVDVEEGLVQLRLREEVAAQLHWPFIQRSEVPRHLLKVLSLASFKEYVLEEQVTPSKLQKILGKRVKEDLEELKAMNLINITPKGKKNIINVTEDFLQLFKLPMEFEKIKIAIQTGLREYALRELQYE